MHVLLEYQHVLMHVQLFWHKTDAAKINHSSNDLRLIIYLLANFIVPTTSFAQTNTMKMIMIFIWIGGSLLMF